MRAKSLSRLTLKSASLWVFLLTVTLSYGVSDWAVYRASFPPNSDSWKLHLLGGIEAPFQYRIGPWFVADWMYRLFHTRPYNSLTLIDIFCLLLALSTLLRVVLRSDPFRSASATTTSLGVVGVLLLVEYYLAWGHWFQTEDTLPSILYVVLSMALVCREFIEDRMLVLVLLVLLSWMQGFVRADVAVVLHVGFVLLILFNRKADVPLGRGWQVVTSLLAALAAGCVQLYLMFVRFPKAKYGASGAVRIVSNLQLEMWATMLLATCPFWLLLGLVALKRYRPPAVTRMLLTSSLLYLLLWVTVGLLDEVRIFLPFAFALIPATVSGFAALLREASDDS